MYPIVRIRQSEWLRTDHLSGPGVISAFEPDDYVQPGRINGISIKVVDNFVEYVNFGDINKCLMTAPEEIAPELEKQLQEKYSDVASIYRSEPYFIEIMPKDVNKATFFLDHMLEGMGLTRECDLLRGWLQ